MPTTAQDVFNAVHARLHDGTGQAMSDDGHCHYRLSRPDVPATACAVGCLLTDEEYHPSMEELTVETLTERNLLPTRLQPYTALLSELQMVHDSRYYWSAGGRTLNAQGKRELAVIATRYNLEVPTHAHR